MRLKLVTATSMLALCLFTAAESAEINQDGADAVKETLTKLLPDDLAKSGFITVNPAGTRYEIIYDLAKLLTKGDPATFTINGLTPFSTFATPLDNGLWNIDGNDTFNVSGHFKDLDQKQTNFTYSIASIVYSGVFDPAISYLRSGTFAVKDVKVASKSEAEEVHASIASMDQKLSSTDTAGGNGRIDFVGSASMSGFVEQVSGLQMPPLEIRASSINVDAKVNGLPAKQIREMIFFMLDHLDEKELSAENTEKIKAIAKEAFPLLTLFSETIGVNDLTVTNEMGKGGAKAFGYNLAIDGPSDAMRFGFGMNAQEISLDTPLMPPKYAPFMPTNFDFQLAVPSLDFASFGDALMKLDVNDGAPEKAGEEMAKKLFRDGRVAIDFPKISAKSQVYDVDMTGRMEGRVDTQKDYSMEATILARDLDKTIAAVQELAKTDPDLNQVSFGIMMVKGFAKTDPDGRSRWDVSISRDGSVAVNGQQIKGPDGPDQDQGLEPDEEQEPDQGQDAVPAPQQQP
ncbi:hypothetical protein [Rhizobium lentis]|uniref:DUF2125 domain-containing protein n=1 Tax=Rhizobium lentis TaxID=1138194 RepID=A0A9Q3M8P3_9HYPH|nr:hypothetical protein [Rhizobium lentis]MBX4955481.1 hypothetical protein [Rhizobium lentis]MBX4973482.1 hypothetical protein [Rhizobium lentis]MBX4984788.1 hypothetical protein [Rhizobium lentis]MBX5003233.1 hypothetical protein [Rhizobium lentis]MBX5011827.1 hypothetical protein [Rhizobium lentis]